MLPLAGTAIEKRLAAEGRLTGDHVRPDYDLLDARLDYCALFVTLNFSFRNSDLAVVPSIAWNARSLAALV